MVNNNDHVLNPEPQHELAHRSQLDLPPSPLKILKPGTLFAKVDRARDKHRTRAEMKAVGLPTPKNTLIKGLTDGYRRFGGFAGRLGAFTSQRACGFLALEPLSESSPVLGKEVSLSSKL